MSEENGFKGPFGPPSWGEVLHQHARYQEKIGGGGCLPIEIHYDTEGRPMEIRVAGRVFRQFDRKGSAA